MQSVMWFLNAKNVFLLEIHRHIVEVHGEGTLNEGNLRKCCHLLKQDRTNLLHEEWSRCLASVTDNLKENVNGKIWGNRQFTISGLQEYFFGRGDSHLLRSNRETKDTVQDWLKILVADIFNEDIQQLVPWHDKCLILHGNCVET